MKIIHPFLASALLAVALTGCNQAESSETNLTSMSVQVRFMDANGLPGPLVTTNTVVKTEKEWHKILTDDEYNITRNKDTEPAFCGAFFDNHKPGVYYCVCCGLPLFTSATKFDSGTGWPSFFQPFAKENVVELADHSHGMDRTEVVCALCGAHLGHVFNDGPAPTGLRFCMNSGALTFKENASFSDGTAKK